MSLPQRIDPTSVEVTGRDIPWKPFGSCEGFVYNILDENLELVREVSIHDFRTAFERW